MRLHVCSSKHCRFADFVNGVIFFVILCSAFLYFMQCYFMQLLLTAENLAVGMDSGTFCRRKMWEVRILGGDDGKSSN